MQLTSATAAPGHAGKQMHELAQIMITMQTLFLNSVPNLDSFNCNPTYASFEALACQMAAFANHLSGVLLAC